MRLGCALAIMQAVLPLQHLFGALQSQALADAGSAPCRGAVPLLVLYQAAPLPDVRVQFIASSPLDGHSPHFQRCPLRLSFSMGCFSESQEIPAIVFIALPPRHRWTRDWDRC